MIENSESSKKHILQSDDEEEFEVCDEHETCRSEHEDVIPRPIPSFPELKLGKPVVISNKVETELKNEDKKVVTKMKRVRERNRTALKKENEQKGMHKVFTQIFFQNLPDKEVKYINGNRIEAQWKKNKIHGHAQIQYETGEYFFGEYQNGNRTKGLVRFKNGTQYQGEFEKDAFNGKGTLKEKDGRIITCVWKKGKPFGKARIEYPKGDIYYGHVQNLKKHGRGYLFFTNGNKYAGQFTHGEITGKGKFYNDKDQIVGEGYWKDGVLQTTPQSANTLFAYTKLGLTNINMDQFPEFKNFLN